MQWQEEYLGALKHRDSLELATVDIYHDYTTLAKKVGSTDDRPDRPANTKELPPASSQIPNPSSRWKDDLVEAQKQRAELQADLSRVNSEFQRLQNQARVDSRRIGDLTLDNSTLSVKLRDRAEELRGKAKLLEDLQHETVALTLQLNLLEEQNQKLKHENNELVDRWMARIGQEADAMNKASDFT
ncbi:hypothetical protein MMC10_006118 [Thelotrema lepadinum]|nr:hypothetical protein [Thelotrema lepadinum]